MISLLKGFIEGEKKMIAQLRVDDRLIHGQVALVWTKELDTPGIVVANDNAANNEMVQMTLKMATPVSYTHLRAHET